MSKEQVKDSIVSNDQEKLKEGIRSMVREETQKAINEKSYGKKKKTEDEEYDSEEGDSEEGDEE